MDSFFKNKLLYNHIFSLFYPSPILSLFVLTSGCARACGTCLKNNYIKKILLYSSYYSIEYKIIRSIRGQVIS